MATLKEIADKNTVINFDRLKTDKKLLSELQENLKQLGLYKANIDGIYGEKTDKAIKLFSAKHWLDNYQTKLIGKTFIDLLLSHGKENIITFSQFMRCFSLSENDSRASFFRPMSQALAEFNIITLVRIAAFFAQVAHESANLKYKEEIASGAAYENRRDLGNIYPGDGRRYKGRGIIQLTGRANYRQAGNALDLPLEKEPFLVLNPVISCRVAGWFWQSRKLNDYADLNTPESFRTICLRVNGGFNGYRDRVNKHQHMKRCLATL